MTTTDLEAIVSILSSLAVFGGLVFWSYQIMLQRRDIRHNTYETLMSHFDETTRFRFEHPEIEKLIPYSPGIEMSEEKRTTFFYLDMLLSLLERVWTSSKEGTLWEASWTYWREWISDLSRYTTFVEHFNWSKKYYDESFVTEVQSIIEAGRSQSRDT